MIWLTIDKATGDVIGWTRSPKATSLPADTAETQYVEVDEGKVAEYEAARNAIVQERRSERPKYTAGKITLPSDGRPVIDVSLSKNTVLADGTDQVLATFTALNKQGATAVSFNNRVVLETLGGRLLALDFVNGVATKAIKMPVSGRFQIESTDKVKIKAGVSIEAIE